LTAKRRGLVVDRFRSASCRRLPAPRAPEAERCRTRSDRASFGRKGADRCGSPSTSPKPWKSGSAKPLRTSTTKSAKRSVIAFETNAFLVDRYEFAQSPTMEDLESDYQTLTDILAADGS